MDTHRNYSVVTDHNPLLWTFASALSCTGVSCYYHRDIFDLAKKLEDNSGVSRARKKIHFHWTAGNTHLIPDALIRARRALSPLCTDDLVGWVDTTGSRHEWPLLHDLVHVWSYALFSMLSQWTMIANNEVISRWPNSLLWYAQQDHFTKCLAWFVATRGQYGQTILILS